MRTFLQWTEATQQDFWSLADQQRDLPEKAMLRVQWAMGGGVLNPVIESVGGFINRMAEKNSFYQAGYEFVLKKVQSCLRYLLSGYGFERDMEENIANNAHEMKIPEEKLREKIYKAMEVYATEHEKLPVYNRAQQLAKHAAVSLGRRKYKETVAALQELESHLGSREDWMKFAHEGLEPPA